jgi:hypothetical protein
MASWYATVIGTRFPLSGARGSVGQNRLPGGRPPDFAFPVLTG